MMILTYFVVETNLTINDETIIIVTPDNNNGIIINNGEHPIVIEGGDIVIDFNNEEDYQKFIEQIKNNKSYEFIVIKGKYNGTFDDLKIQLSSNITSCERLKPHIKEDENQLSYTFTIDKSGCSTLKWWMILLIVIGALLILTIIFIILVVTIKPLRRKILPFRERRKNYERENENENIQMSHVYKSKSKVNPLA